MSIIPIYNQELISLAQVVVNQTKEFKEMTKEDIQKWAEKLSKILSAYED